MEVKTIVLIENMKKYFLKYQVANENSTPENIILINGVKHELSPEKQIQNLKNTLDKVKGFLIEKGLFAECVGYINTQKPRA